MSYLLGVDIGTSGTKTVLYDELGNTIASSLEEYPLYQPILGGQSKNRKTGGGQHAYLSNMLFPKAELMLPPLRELDFQGRCMVLSFWTKMAKC